VAASTGPTPITAPDSYGTGPGKPGYLACHGAEVLTLQVFNAAIVWQIGIGSPPVFDNAIAPEVNQAPAYRSTSRRADAIRFRASVPAAQLPAGQPQATVSIDTTP
jgi:hypothetical protein